MRGFIQVPTYQVDSLQNKVIHHEYVKRCQREKDKPDSEWSRVVGNLPAGLHSMPLFLSPAPSDYERGVVDSCAKSGRIEPMAAIWHE